MVRDGNVFEAVEWYQWLIAGAVCLAACLLCGRWKIPKGRRRLVKTVFLAGGAVCGAVAVFVVLGRGIDDSFGSGRGFLWRIALESFRAADGKDMLLGAGPDCYAEAVFNRLGAGSDVWKGEHWETAVFTNAHNEILSQLCNIGILGTMSYLAIFLTGLYQCRPVSEKPGGSHGGTGKAGTGPGLSRTERQSPGNTDEYILWVGFMAIAMYGAHALISFQQVLNAPFFFLVLGLCGSVGRTPGAGPRRHEYALEYGERIGEDNEVEEI